MKKILFLFPVFLFLFMTSSTSAQDVCIQVIQPAVDANGNCQEFSTPCDVPDNWKKLPVASCSEVKTNTNGSRIDEVDQRRRVRWARALRKKALEKNPEIEARKYKKRSDRPRFGRGGYTKNNDVIDTDTNRKRASLASKARRTFNQKSYDKDFLKKRRQYRTNKGGYQHYDKADKEERAKRRSARPSFMSRGDANRSGALSNDPKLEERQKQRFRSTNHSRHWKNRLRKPKVKKAKADPRRKIGQRRTYRGTISERRNADGESIITEKKETTESK